MNFRSEQVKTSQHRERVLTEYILSIKQISEVRSVILTGGSGRGDGDSFSDIDIVVVVSTIPQGLAEGKFRRDGELFDVRIALEQELLSSVWSQDMYYAYLNGKVAHDSSDFMASLIEAKRIEWRNSVPDQVIMDFVQLSVLLEIADNWKGLQAQTHLEKFKKRQDFVSAHRCLSLALEILIDLHFLIEKEVPPDSKNKFRILLHRDDLHPSHLELCRDALLVKGLTLEEINRRESILIELFKFMRERIADWDTPDNFYSYYLANRA